HCSRSSWGAQVTNSAAMLYMAPRGKGEVRGKAAHAGNNLADGQHYAACARALGHSVEGVFAGGCADSGFAASVCAPTICAVGAIGGRFHAPEEYLEVASIVPRAQALALAIMRLDAVPGG